MYKRFILRRTDKDHLKRAEKHDEIYSWLDEVFGSDFSSPVPLQSKIDTKFFLDEIADNFLIHDGSFETAKIDVSISRQSLDVDIKVYHDGREFNPLDVGSTCHNIKAAAARLKLKPPHQNPISHLDERFGLSYNLAMEEEVQS